MVAAFPLDGLSFVKNDAFSLEDARGQVLVVEFWATWCPPCRESIPHLTELQAKYMGDVRFLGISAESVDTVRSFVAQQGTNMDYWVAADPSRQVTSQYMQHFQARGIPMAVLIGANGEMVGKFHPAEPDFETKLQAEIAKRYQVLANLPESELMQKRVRSVQLPQSSICLCIVQACAP
ncbi:MAG: hypothetical protein MHM6MM_006137 [Cercozoa sp. M6MM]